jgi:HEAT repeat protein
MGYRMRRVWLGTALLIAGWLGNAVAQEGGCRALIQNLTAGDVEQRIASAKALASIHEAEARKALLSALEDPEARVRREVALSLGSHRNRKVAQQLIHTLADDQDPDVRAGAGEALGQIRSKKALSPLTEALWDKDPGVRLAAAKALGQMADPRATLALAERLKDSDPAVRRTAAASMARTADHRAIRPLIECLKDDDAKVKAVALEGLRALTAEDFGEDYDRWAGWFRKEYKYEAIRFEED